MAHNNGMIPRSAKGGRGKGSARGLSEAAEKFRAAAAAVPIEPAGTAYDPGPPNLDQINANAALAGGGIGNLPLHGATGAELAGFVPHRPARPEKSEGGKRFKLVSEYQPAGDQPAAIEELVGAGPLRQRARPGAAGRHGFGQDLHYGKVIEALQRPGADPGAQQDAGGTALRRDERLFSGKRGGIFRLLLRLLPARGLHPPHRHLYREGFLHQRGDRPHAPCGHARDPGARRRHHRGVGLLHLRHRFGRNLFRHGSDHRTRAALGSHGSDAAALRRCSTGATTTISCAAPSACAATPSTFSRRITKTAPGASSCSATRWNPSANSIRSPAARRARWTQIKIYANSHYVTPRPTLAQAMKGIKHELIERLAWLRDNGKLLEAQRLEQRTTFDLEMIEATGSCAGIENYSRWLTGRKPGEPPPTLFEYLPDEAMVFVDESHVTVPQIGGMYRRRLSPKGDARRIWLPPAVLHRQPAAQIRGMGRDAAADRLRFSHARAVGAGAHRRRIRRTGDPPDRADRSAGRSATGRKPGRRSDSRMPRRWPSAAIARWSRR